MSVIFAWEESFLHGTGSLQCIIHERNKVSSAWGKEESPSFILFLFIYLFSSERFWCIISGIRNLKKAASLAVCDDRAAILWPTPSAKYENVEFSEIQTAASLAACDDRTAILWPSPSVKMNMLISQQKGFVNACVRGRQEGLEPCLKCVWLNGYLYSNFKY